MTPEAYDQDPNERIGEALGGLKNLFLSELKFIYFVKCS